MSIKIDINQVEYSNSLTGATLHIFGRDEFGNSHKIDINGFKPYFYAPVSQADLLPVSKGSHVDITKTYTTITGLPLRKIYLQYPNDSRDIRQRYQHFEADIPFGTRFMIDCNIKSGILIPSTNVDYGDVEPVDTNFPAKVCIADIECEDHRGFPEPERDAIIAITTHDSFTDKYTTFVISDKLKNSIKDNREIIVFADEITMMKNFMIHIKQMDPDILSGWNFTEFDLPYILKRCLFIGLDPAVMARLPGKIDGTRPELKGRNIFDMLSAYKRVNVAHGLDVSYRLDAIAEKELGERKIKYEGKLTDLLKNDPQKLVDYNAKDVELCVNINKKSQVINFFREISRYVGCPLDKSLNSSSVIDIYILRKVNGNYVLPSKGSVSLESFKGATVFEPYTGLAKNVGVFDLKSLYPMSMMTLNASPETKDPNGEIHSPNGVKFKKHPDGLTRSIIAELLKERDIKKAERNKYPFHSPEYNLYDMQQNVVKVIMNTYYGVSGYPKFRLFDHDIGGAVTSTGRAIIEYTKNIIEKDGYKVIYGDSVTGDMKIDLGEKIVCIKSLFTNIDIATIDEKEYCILNNITVPTITDTGYHVYKNVKYIMRHKTHKQIYRVTCDNGYYVDVTEDHSLIAANIRERYLYEIKPTNIIINETDLIREYGFMKVVSVEPIQYDDYVYDIEVEDTHRFFANNILVHNTDSSMLEFPEEDTVIPLAKTLEKKLNDAYPTFAKDHLNADDCYFSTKFEKIYRRFYQAGTKKRYAGHLIWKEGQNVDDIDIVGFEFKRSDSSQITKTVQKTLIEMILHGADIEEVKRYMTPIIKNYKSLPLDDIGIPGGLGKALSSYETDDAQVRGCKYANEYLGAHFVRGSKPKRIYIKNVTSKYPRTDVLCFEYGKEVPKEFVPDYDIMMEKTLKQPISRIINPLGWTWNDFDPSVRTLASFGLE